MASININQPEEDEDDGIPPPRMPGWMHDFCDDLREIYQTSRKSFHAEFPNPKSPEHSSLLQDWLNLFEIMGRSAQAPNEFIVRLPAGSKTQIHISASRVYTDTNALDAKTALEMAMLAKANPAMSREPVTLEGTAQEMKLLALACKQVGLQVANPPPIHEADKKLLKDTETAWEKYHVHLPKQSEKRKKMRTARYRKENIYNASLTEEARKALGTVDLSSYQRAKEGVWKDQKVSQKKLMEDFGFSSGDAGKVLNAMRQESFIYKPAANKHAVCVDAKCNWAVDI